MRRQFSNSISCKLDDVSFLTPKALISKNISLVASDTISPGDSLSVHIFNSLLFPLPCSVVYNLAIGVCNLTALEFETNASSGPCTSDDLFNVDNDQKRLWLRQSYPLINYANRRSTQGWCRMPTERPDMSVADAYRLIIDQEGMKPLKQTNVYYRQMDGDQLCAESCRSHRLCGAAAFVIPGNIAPSFVAPMPPPPPPRAKWSAECVDAQPPLNQYCVPTQFYDDPCECGTHQFVRPTLRCDNQDVIFYRQSTTSRGEGKQIVYRTLPQAIAQLNYIQTSMPQTDSYRNELSHRCPWQCQPSFQQTNIPQLLGDVKMDAICLRWELGV